MTDINYVLESIKKERERQDEKWGQSQTHTLEVWFMILAEEYGEAAKEANELYFHRYHGLDKIKAELVQTAAVCVAILESL